MWRVVGHVVAGRCQTYAWQRPATTCPTTFHVCKTRGWYCSFRLLMMGGVSPETCWASYKYGITNFDTLLHLVGFSIWIVLWCTDPQTTNVPFRFAEYWWTAALKYVSYWTVTNWSMNQGPRVSSVKHYCIRLWFERHQVRKLVKTLIILNFSWLFSASTSNTRVADPETFSLLIRWPPYQARQIFSPVVTMSKNWWLASYNQLMTRQLQPTDDSPVTTNSFPPEARVFPYPRSELIKLVGVSVS